MNRLTTFIFLLLSLVMMLFTLAGNHGLLSLERMDREIRQLKQKNEELSEESAAVQGQIQAIRQDGDTLEQKARDELGLAKPNEIVYIFPEGKKPEGK